MSDRIQETVFIPVDHLHVSDVQQMLLVRNSAPPEWNAAVDLKEPEHFHIIEQQKEIWTCLDGQQLTVKEETDANMFPVTIKSDDDEEKPLFSQLHQQEMEDLDVPTISSADQMTTETDVQQMLLVRNSTPTEWNTAVDQQEPEPLHIKEEREEFWTSLEGEQLSVKEETDTTNFPVSMKSEDDEEKPLFSQLHQQEMEDSDVPTSSSADQMKTETGRNPDLNADEESCISSETEVSGDDEEDDDDVNLDSERSDSGSKTEDSDNDFKESRASESDVNTVNTFSCSECEKQFLHKRALQSHMTCHLRTKSTNCLDNKKSFRDKAVDTHGKVPKGLKSFSCDDCGKIFNTPGYLNTHMRIHTGQKPFVCDVCGQRFNEKGTLNTHMRIHTGQKPFVCEVCGQRFSQRGSLNSHMRIHTGQKPFMCDVCEQRFSEKGTLNRHMTIHTGQKPFMCDVCEQRFSLKGSLNSHMKIHTGQKPFVCEVCKQRFSRKGYLNRHMTVHTGQKPFVCDICEQRFSSKGTLNSHMRIHTGQKPFVCDVCEQRFCWKGYLNAHMRIHTGQELFVCDVCEQRFTLKGTLNLHMRIHTGEKPFECDVCEQKFSQKGHLKSHMRIHTRVKTV